VGGQSTRRDVRGSTRPPVARRRCVVGGRLLRWAVWWGPLRRRGVAGSRRGSGAGIFTARAAVVTLRRPRSGARRPPAGHALSARVAGTGGVCRRTPCWQWRMARVWAHTPSPPPPPLLGPGPVGPPSRICHRRARVLPARVWMRLRNMRLGASARLAPGPHARGARAPPHSPSKRAWKRTGPAVKTAWEAHFSLRRWMDVEDATPVGGGGAMAVPPRRDGSPSLVPPPPLRRGADDASGPSRHSKNCLCLEIQSAKTRQLSLGLLDNFLVSTLLVVIQLRESGSQHPAVTVVVSCPRPPPDSPCPRPPPPCPPRHLRRRRPPLPDNDRVRLLHPRVMVGD